METTLDVVGEGNSNGMVEARDVHKSSFRDTLMGVPGDQEDFLNPDDESFISNDEEICTEDEEDDCPTIHLSRKEKARLRKPWRQTLIIKVMGRTVGYAYLLRRIKALWKPKGPIEMVAVENNYFLVKFASLDDYNFAKFEGPWMILDHYLIVKEWSPNFDPTLDLLSEFLCGFDFLVSQLSIMIKSFS